MRGTSPQAATISIAALLVAGFLALFGPNLAQAACTLSGSVTTWSLGASGFWNVSGNWDLGVPDSTTSACIVDGTSTVTVASATAGLVRDIELATNNGLSLDPNTLLAVYGTQIVNGGAIQVNGGGGTNTELIVNSSNVMLQGGGTVTLSTASGGGDALIIQGVAGSTLTNVDNTIQGAGIIGNNGLSLNNAATINANVGGQVLLLNGGGTVTNTNLLEATNNGVLQISGVVVDNGGGNITADGGTVQLLAAADIQGGTLNAVNGGMLGTATGQQIILDGSTGAGAVNLNGTYTGGLNSLTFVKGTINNTNNIQLNGGNGSNTGLVAFSSNVTLQGGGTVTLSTASGGGDALIIQGVAGSTLTNVDNTIQGAGIIGNNGLSLNNAATINANVGGQVLLLNGGGAVTNTNLLEATNGGFLQINGVTVDNAGGNITADGGTVQLLAAADIQGGTLNAVNGGMLGTATGQQIILDGSTGAGAVNLNGTYTGGLNSLTFVKGTINNTNNIQLNGGNGSNTGLVAFSSNVTLQGGGTVTLSTASGGGDALIIQGVAGSTLTNVDNTIQGAGIIGNNGLTLVNNTGGTLLANAPGQTLLINGGGTLTNHGTMQVDSGATMHLTNVGFSTDGTTSIEAGGDLISDVSYKQTGGTTQFDGTLTAGLGMDVSGGAVEGTGTIDGNVLLSNATMSPGDSGLPGTLAINGNYDQANATFLELISDTSNGLLDIAGTEFLGAGALLDINLLGGFVPNAGDMFTIADFASDVGEFANAPSGQFTMNGFDWSIAYNANDIVLTFGATGPGPTVPEPHTLALMAIAAAALVLVRRRGMRSC